jgi:hypothetical protein
MHALRDGDGSTRATRLTPRFHEPFVIVDPRLRLQAVSHHAEVTLGLDEPAAIDVPLAKFLVCRTERDQIDLARLVGRPRGGSRSVTSVALRTVGDPPIEVLARVAGWGPPPAAVLTLTPLRTPRTRRNRRAQRSAAVADRTFARWASAALPHEGPCLRLTRPSARRCNTAQSSPTTGSRPRHVSIRRAGRNPAAWAEPRRRGWGEPRRRGGFRRRGRSLPAGNDLAR